MVLSISIPSLCLATEIRFTHYFDYPSGRLSIQTNSLTTATDLALDKHFFGFAPKAKLQTNRIGQNAIYQGQKTGTHPRTAALEKIVATIGQ